MNNSKDFNRNIINSVIEIEEVEYFIDKPAAEKIERKEELVTLKRIIDKKDITFKLKDIIDEIEKSGVVDHLS